jgi:hypothetical protein
LDEAVEGIASGAYTSHGLLDVADAFVSPEDRHFLQQNKNPQGLKAAVGQWEEFEEIADAIDDAVRTRRCDHPSPIFLR